MALSGLGDAARLLSGQRQATDLKLRLARLGQELSTGQAADPVRAMRGDTRPLADIERRLALADGWGLAAREAGTRLGAMQAALDGVEGTRAGLVGRLLGPAATDSATSREGAAAAAVAAFDDLVRDLNLTASGGSLFAGVDSGGPALAPAGDMLASLRAAASGATAAADVEAALDAWFDTPTGGFATMGYLGAATSAARPLDEGETVTLAARADDPSLRAVLKATALAALAADPAVPLPPGEAQALLGVARDALLTAGTPLTGLRAGLGLSQARADEAVARHAAGAVSWGIVRAGMTEVDPYATASTLQAVQAQIEIHYEVSVRLASLSLANYLR